VPQFYIHQLVSTVTRPVKELRGFQRVHLKPGEKATLEFRLTPESLSMLDEHMDRVVQPGTFELLVGANSAQTTAISLRVAQH
jgi:beta-glucosidase